MIEKTLNAVNHTESADVRSISRCDYAFRKI